MDAVISGLITGNTYALIALGLSLIFGVADLINFAHGSVLAVGAMVGWLLAVVLHWPLWATLLGAVAVAALLGLVIERVGVRPFAGAPPIAPLLSTVAISLMLDYLSQLIFHPETRAFPSLLPNANFQAGGVRFGALDLAILAVTVASVAALWAFLKYSRLGWAIRATAEDREAAAQMGVSVGAVQGLSFAIASALAGVGGVLIGMYYKSVDPAMGFNASIEGFAAATLGGLGSLPGAVVGGLGLGVVEALGVQQFGGSARQLIAFAVLILVLWLRPNGLFGAAGVRFREPLTGTFFRGGSPLRLRRWQLALLALLLLLGLPLWQNNYALQVASIVAIYATLALSLTLLTGTAGQVSIGQAGLFAVGAYTSALLTKEHGWPFWLALPAAGAVATLVGAIIVSPALSLRGHYAAIATLAIGAIIGSALLNFEGLTHGPLGVTNIPSPALFGYAIQSPRDFYLLCLALLGLAAALVLRLQRSHLGRAWRAIREDEIAAQSFGVPLNLYKALAFAIGGFIAGVAGSLLAAQYGYLNPSIFDVSISILALTIVVLGGMANVLGAVAGAVVLVGGPEIFRPLADARLLAYGVLLILLLRFRPQGIMGSR